MKKLLLFAFLACTFNSVKAQSQVWALETDNGTTVALSNVDFLLAADNDSAFTIVVKQGEAISGVLKATVTTTTQTGISTIKAQNDKTSVLMAGSSLVVFGTEANAQVGVYSIDGAQQRVNVSRGDVTTVDVSALKKGTYVLKVGERAVKFVKK
jgi:hypothetical protein